MSSTLFMRKKINALIVKLLYIT